MFKLVQCLVRCTTTIILSSSAIYSLRLFCLNYNLKCQKIPNGIRSNGGRGKLDIKPAEAVVGIDFDKA